MKIAIPSHLSDTELVAQVKSLARRGHEVTAHLIAHLAELDARRIYLGAGFPSLFAYGVHVLRLSEAEAYNRIEAARAARRFPIILDRLADGSLNLTTVRLLAPCLTADNHLELLAAGCGKSRREVEELRARLRPRPDVASSVRKLPSPRPAPKPLAAADSAAASGEPLPRATLPGDAAAVVLLPSLAPTVVQPLAPDRYAVRFTASAETCEKLELARDMLRHTVPTGDTAAIIDRALTVLLRELARKRFGQTDRPRAGRGPAPGSRHVAARVRRAVWLRDLGRCAYVAESGQRCRARSTIEFHHVDPYGVGGEATVETMALRCRAHNNYEAALFYGRPPPTRSGTSTPPSSVASRPANVRA